MFYNDCSESPKGLGMSATKFSLLHVDDDPEIRQIVSMLLPESLELFEASNLAQAETLLAEQRFHMILLDLNLAGESGFGLISVLKKKEFAFMPKIIVMTGSHKEEDEIQGHQFEVDEYIRKPLKPAVFRALMQKYVTKFEGLTNAVRTVGPLKIYPEKMQVKIKKIAHEEDLLLTLKEFKLLIKFIENPSVEFTREKLFREVWDASSEIQSRTIDMHVSSLRKKLGDFGQSIVSVRGIGYSFQYSKEIVY